MAEPFEERSSRSRGILSRARTTRKRTFVMDVENAFARASRLVDVKQEKIEELAERHGVDLAKSVRTPRRNLYRRFLEHCLADHALSADESADLSHLRAILKLPDDEVQAIHNDVARVFYGRAMDQVLADYRLDPEEEEFLQRLRSELDLDDEVATELHEEGLRRSKQRFIGQAVASDSVFVTAREAKLELSGRSETTLEEAVRLAFGEAHGAGADLHSAEVSEIRVELRDGKVGAWCVKLIAALQHR